MAYTKLEDVLQEIKAKSELILKQLRNGYSEEDVKQDLEELKQLIEHIKSPRTLVRT